MIFHPKVGQHVRVHYAKRWALLMRWQGREGIVRVTAGGRGPRNVGVEIDGALAVVPRGNLVAMPQKTSGPEAAEVGKGAKD